MAGGIGIEEYRILLCSHCVLCDHAVLQYDLQVLLVVVGDGVGSFFLRV